MHDTQIPSRTYDLITVVALGVVTGDRSQRQRAGLDAIDDRDWDEVARRLAEVEAEDDPGERTRRIRDSTTGSRRTSRSWPRIPSVSVRRPGWTNSPRAAPPSAPTKG